MTSKKIRESKPSKTMSQEEIQGYFRSLAEGGVKLEGVEGRMEGSLRAAAKLQAELQSTLQQLQSQSQQVQSQLEFVRAKIVSLRDLLIQEENLRRANGKKSPVKVTTTLKLAKQTTK